MTRAASDLLDSLQDPDSRETSTQAHDARGSVEVLRCGCGGNLEVPVPPPPAAGGLLKAIVVACPACQAPLTMDPNVGRVLARQWRLERRLGHGGMGSVYLATELRLDRKVAVKVLHQHLAAIPEFRERFEREARVMARLEHSNLATLFAVEVDQQVPFLVMKVVRGHTLGWLATRRPGSWPLCEVLPIVAQMGAALSELHRCGFVHRDLKPGNIMVTATGHVTLLDYGLTRTTVSTLTQPGVVLGSPTFMSPEQVMARPLDARSDQYSLALLCSLLLTGRLPYAERSTMTTLLQHVEHEPEAAHVSNPAVPRAVSDVLLKALRKRAQDRYESVERFLVELGRAAGSTAAMAVEESLRDEFPTHELPSRRPTPAPTRATRTPRQAPPRALRTAPPPPPGPAPTGSDVTTLALPAAPASPRLTGHELARALAHTVIRPEAANATVEVEVEVEVPSTRPMSVPDLTPGSAMSDFIDRSPLPNFMPTVSDAPGVPDRAPPRRASKQVRAAAPVPELRWRLVVLGALATTLVLAATVLVS